MLLSILAVMGSLSWGQPAQAPGYTLGAAVDAALQRSPVVGAAGHRVRAADSALREAQMKRLPSLTAYSAFTRGDDPVYVFGTRMEQKVFTASDFDVYSLNNPSLRSNFRNAFEIGVPLFTGLELQSQERLGRLGREAAASQKDGALQRTRYAAMEAFLQVMLQQELLQAVTERVAASGQELESARRLREKGLVLGSDYYAAGAILGGLRVWQTRLEAGLQAAKSSLAVLLGKSPSELAVSGRLGYAEYPLEPESELAGRALRERPELRQIDLQSGMAEAVRRKEGFSLLPKVEAFASVQTNTRDFDSNPWNRMAGVRASLPLGDPGYPARRARSQAMLEASRSEAQRMREEASREVSRSYQELRGAAASLPLAKQTADQAGQSLDMFRPLYREGRQSILEVLRAEEGLARSQAAYLETLYAVHMGRARLLLAAGGLDSGAVREVEQGLEVRP
ncbi:MAG: TolC family protein [Elusimicrobiota bacterium]|jgi:outer membrane protein TolC